MMKVLFVLLVSFVMLLFARPKIDVNPSRPVLAYPHNISICGNPILAIQAGNSGKFISLLPGTGHHSYAISTMSDSAQRYFNQGLSFYYGYHLPEAAASFKEAARFDEHCVMAYWGQALAMGPYYNNYYYKMNKEVPFVLLSMQRENRGITAKENDLVGAMLSRYSSDTTNADRRQLDLNYASAMQQLIKKYPGDNDIKALYVDAVMLCHKWDFWNNGGTPKTWTPELIKLTIDILKTDSLQPAALHYYIHLTEASRHPETALLYAERLRRTTPGIGHMVHMSTHVYQRNGLFARGVLVNEQANDIYNQVDSLTPSLHLGRNNVIHIYAVQSYCAMNAGMYNKGLPIYQRTRQRLLAQKPDFNADTYAQFVYMIPEMAFVRLGKWGEILKESAPDTQWKFATLLDDFAKGMALVHMQDIAGAKQHLKNLKDNLGDDLLAIRKMPYNKPQQSGRIAFGILSGEILYAEGKLTEALAAFQKAVNEEDLLIYREPQDWFIPSRQYLGYYLLKANLPMAATKVYRQDLVANPGNGWSLLGLSNSLKARHQLKEAASYQSDIRKAFANADHSPVSSVY